MDADYEDFEEDDLDQYEELEVLEGEQPIDDDPDENEEGESGMVEDVPDASFFSFDGHHDAVYCAAFHPTINGLIATGMNWLLVVSILWNII